MNYIKSLVLALIFLPVQTFAWTITADFEDGAVGTMAQTVPGTQLPADAFHNAAGHSLHVSSPALSGSQAASVKATAGENGFGVWGGRFAFPTKLVEGDEVWFRANVYYPTGWNFSCNNCTEGMKFMRIHTQSATNSNEGYHHTFIKGEEGETGGLINASTEVDNQFWSNGQKKRGIGSPAPRNQWITYEMQIKFHSEANNGIYRIWQDGVLIFEDLKTPTLRSATSRSGIALLYTYWNNGAPKTQTSYVDDIVITSEVPGRKDAHGNPFIGVGASIYIAPPKPPTPSAN